VHRPRNEDGEPVSDERAILDAVDRLLVPGENRYTRAELARRAGIDPDEASRTHLTTTPSSPTPTSRC